LNLIHSSQLKVKIGNTLVCRDLTIECKAGEVWGVLGRNGKGKTTLLHTLAGLRPAISGEIFIQQNSIHQLTRRQIAQQLGVLLQHHEDSFPCSVIETVISGRHPHINHWQWESRNDWDIAHKALQSVQLSHLAQRPVNQLSGGERQRVAIATLITQNPQIMLLDEPNSHLDLKYQIMILDYLFKLTKSAQKTILMTLHDINLAARYCDKLILLMGDGEVQVGEANELLSEDNLQKLYDYPVTRIDSENFPLFFAK